MAHRRPRIHEPDGERTLPPFAVNLKALRERHGLTHREVAAWFGYSRNTPSQWEGGLREPCYADLVRLADELGTTIDHLLGVPGADRDSPDTRRIQSALHQALAVQEAVLAGTTPTERLGVCVQYLLQTVSPRYTRARIASQLLLGPPALDRLLSGQATATPTVILRLAEMAGIPEAWFYVPNPRLAELTKAQVP